MRRYVSFARSFRVLVRPSRAIPTGKTSRQIRLTIPIHFYVPVLHFQTRH